MPPALADQHRVARRAGAEGVAAGRWRASSTDPVAGSSSEDAAAAAALQQVASPIASTPRLAEPSVAISMPSGAGASALTALRPVAKTALRLRRRRLGIDAHLASGQRHGEAAAGQQASAEIGRSKVRTSVGGVPVEAQKPWTVGEDQIWRRRSRDPPARRIRGPSPPARASGSASSAPSNDGTVMVASPRPRKRLANSLTAPITRCRPHRFSYWTKFRIGAVELVAADAVVGDAAEIEIAAMLAHRRDHRMVDAA